MNLEYRIFDRWKKEYIDSCCEFGQPGITADGEIIFYKTSDRMAADHYKLIKNIHHERFLIEPYINKQDINKKKCYLNDLIEYRGSLWIVLEEQKNWGYQIKRLNHTHYLDFPEKFKIVNTLWEYMRGSKI